MHERKRIRLLGFDYTKVGAYFITSVVKNRTCVFGNVRNEAVELTRCGEIVRQQWLWLQQQYPYVRLDEFVVMPNHIHGKIKPLSELVGAFKTTSSKRIHEAGVISFQWQRSFFERIVRNDLELNRIREYIRTNPSRWELDVENQKGALIERGRASSQHHSTQDYYNKIIRPS
jgi:putative transposase